MIPDLAPIAETETRQFYEASVSVRNTVISPANIHDNIDAFNDFYKSSLIYEVPQNINVHQIK